MKELRATNERLREEREASARGFDCHENGKTVAIGAIGARVAQQLEPASKTSCRTRAAKSAGPLASWLWRE
eukprot:15474524-Alexandrium_andersonii.AAC.1